MAATPARIGFILQEFRTVSRSDSAVKTRYGDVARDTKGDPFETFFDSTADTDAMALERFNLLSANRRRFRQEAKLSASFKADFDFSQVTPTATVIDDERSANHAAAIVEIGIDYGANKATLVTWG